MSAIAKPNSTNYITSDFGTERRDATFRRAGLGAAPQLWIQTLKA